MLHYRPRSFPALREQVVDKRCVMTVQMGELRDIAGYQRLGNGVVDSIERVLAGLGLAHFPPELPTRQEELVRLYVINSAIGELIDQVQKAL